MNGVQAKVVRERLDNAFKLLGNIDATNHQKMKELWAIMSDIQLWMADVEERLERRRN